MQDTKHNATVIVPLLFVLYYLQNIYEVDNCSYLIDLDQN